MLLSVMRDRETLERILVEGGVVGTVGSTNKQAGADASVAEFISIQACVQGVEPVAESGYDVVESMDVVVDGRVMCDANIIRPSIEVMVCESSRGDVSDLNSILSPNKFETLCSVAVEQDMLVSPPRMERFVGKDGCSNNPNITEYREKNK
ncbi:hypothetical protein V6N12_050350 [Hibiscus sabdariffa]|uniref:Uncharacterized protein n=1 Tax=Hibiscus sabdariffa TaxID=183260 RepID=A0ABR2GDA1_9ROSI